MNILNNKPTDTNDTDIYHYHMAIDSSNILYQAY